MGIFYNGDRILNESFLINKNDIYKNFDKFESGKSNVLLITGLTGSGKSTLASQLASKYKAEYIELDIIDPQTNIVVQGWDTIKKAGDVFYEFFQSHKNYYDAICNKNMSHKDISIMADKFLEYCFSYARKHKDQKFIIEGIQIYEYYNYYKKSIPYPIICKGTSVVTSFLRKIKREEWEFNHVIKNSPEVIKFMIKADKDLKSVIKSMNESTYVSDDYEFKIFDQNGKSINEITLSEFLDSVVLK